MAYQEKRDDTISRLIRLESKLVRGFEELGVSLQADRNWLTVDNRSKTVYLSTIGNSLVTVLQEMKNKGASETGEFYDIIHKGDLIGYLKYSPKF